MPGRTLCTQCGSRYSNGAALCIKCKNLAKMDPEERRLYDAREDAKAYLYWAERALKDYRVARNAEAATS